MLKLTYVPVDEHHASAVVQYPDVLEINSTDTGIRFIDPETDMERMVHYKKLLKIEFKINVPKEFVNRANNIMRIKKKNAPARGNSTVR